MNTGSNPGLVEVIIFQSTNCRNRILDLVESELVFYVSNSVYNNNNNKQNTLRMWLSNFIINTCESVLRLLT